jgi:superfamily II DNA or RNA helicase
MFRKHQDSFGELCHDIRTGRVSNVRHIICSVTPGGGKSFLPLIAASQLLGTVAERICWVVPRRALQQQAESEFQKPYGRELLGHEYSIRRATNEPDPCRGLAGFATTYQAIGMGNYYLREEFAQRRYILVLDEPHHVEEGGAWEAALAPLVQRAALTVFMSGTLERGNRKRIGFLPYANSSQGERVDLSGIHAPTIEYSRRDALLDRAILPIHFELMDGTAQWIGRDGETYSTTLSSANKDTAEALYTALKTQVCGATSR